MIIERVALRGPLPADTWPFTLAPVRQLAAPGLELDTDLTFLVGENGSGKSTLIEAIVKRPVVVEGDAIAVRPMTILGLSWDHRALDGALAAQFLAAVKRRIEAWT